MLKRVLIIGLLLSVAAAMLGTRAEAHYIYVSGRLIKHSLLCSLDLKGVANPATNPALSECVIEVHLLDILCRNPQNNNTHPGRAATQTVLIAEDQIDQSDITGKGKAHVEILVEDDPLLNPEFCVNPNWIPIEVLVREATVHLNTFTCTDDACSTKVLASTAQLDCVLPSEFNLENLPPVGTPYQCTQTSSQHLK